MAFGAVDLSLEASDGSIAPGATFSVSLVATADGDAPEAIAAMDVVIGWDPAKLTLLGIDEGSGGAFLSAGFPDGDASGVNEANPPSDGDALFTALSQFGNPFAATPEGALVVDFVFEAVSEGATVIEILASAGDPAVVTKVFSASVPNLDILGSTSPASITIGPPCTPDLSNDGFVDSGDLALLLDAFGASSEGDLNDDGVTDSVDLNLLLADFGEEC